MIQYKWYVTEDKLNLAKQPFWTIGYRIYEGVLEYLSNNYEAIIRNKFGRTGPKKFITKYGRFPILIDPTSNPDKAILLIDGHEALRLERRETEPEYSLVSILNPE